MKRYKITADKDFYKELCNMSLTELIDYGYINKNISSFLKNLINNYLDDMYEAGFNDGINFKNKQEG